MATQPSGLIPYTPNYRMYSRAPEGWHDEPFEYVFNFQQTFTSPTTIAATSLYNQPLQFDPDADFYMRGISAYQNAASIGFSTQILMAMRLRNAFNRQLDSNFIPLNAYCGSPNFTGTPNVLNPWQATPWFPELYCPANSALWADFQAIATVSGGKGGYFSFQVYFQGIKRFKNETCKPQTGGAGS